jgi:hypothetical protein
MLVIDVINIKNTLKKKLPLSYNRVYTPQKILWYLFWSMNGIFIRYPYFFEFTYKLYRESVMTNFDFFF